jgi:long-chain acyl-CoA synthetase
MSVISLWQRGTADPDGVAIIDPQERTWTYGELLADANRWSNALRALGVERGDRVALASPNSFDWLAVFAATMQIGVRLVPVNFHLTGPEVAHILSDSQSKVFVADESIADAAIRARVDASLTLSHAIGLDDISGFIPSGKLLAEHPATPPADRSPGQRMYYSSGTTGKPKGVLKEMVDGDVDDLAIAQTKKMMGTTGRDQSPDGVTLVPGPLYHGAPLGAAIGALHCGQTLVLMDRWDAVKALELIQRHRVTSTTMVPTMFQRLLKLDPDVRDRYDLSSLENVTHAGAPCAIAVKNAMIDWFGPVLNEFYSAVEGGGTQVSSEEWLKRPGTVGRPGSGSAIKILGDDNEELAPNEVGRVFMLLKEPFEYFNDPAKTRDTIVGDFFTVGDIGYVDEEGYLFLCDRAANTIISGGVNIYPAESEAVLQSHPKVQDAAVFGVPNTEWGEEVKAVVELRDGMEPTPKIANELLEYCASQLAKFKCPRSIDFAVDLPRDDNGKLYKRRLREQYWAGRDRNI